jgi:DNA-3-methyladenine glycosylase
MKLDRSFYLQEDVVSLARSFIGKILVSRLNNCTCSGIITETEAYNGITDKASHAYGGRRTRRTEIMYAEGGTAYVYLIYGIHSLFNIVTNKQDVPHAVLIRAIQPLEGIACMEERRKKPATSKGFTGGPGVVSEAMGIHYSHSGISLLGNEIWIEDRGIQVTDADIVAGPRIGVDYAGEDALLPYRFNLKDPAIRINK